MPDPDPLSTSPEPRESRSDADARITRLEQRVVELEALLRDARPRERRRRRTRVTNERRTQRWEYRSEQWLGRVGLGLFFLGLIYLFQYSVEQGWITPTVRVAFGLSIGAAMLYAGMRLGETRRSFGQILLAGSLAVFYASGWAAFQLYALVGHGVALGYMTGVMVLALALSLHRNQPALASLGAAGGFLTPLLLQRGPVPVTELAVYTILVVGWSGWVYGVHGWRALLWTYSGGALAALALATESAAGGERMVVQLALVIAWVLAGAFPFARGMLVRAGEGRPLWGLIPFTLQLRALGVGVTTAAVLLSGRLWGFGDPTTGGIFLACAMGYGLFAWAGTRRPDVYARAAAPVAGALCATGTYLLVSGAPALVAILSIQAALCVYLGRGERYAGIEWVGHTLFGLLALDLGRDLLSSEWRFLDPLAMAQALQLALLLAASFYLRRADHAWIYRIGAHLLVLAWLGKELSPVSAGRATVTVAWGAYGAILLAAALQLRDRRGAATLALQAVAFSALTLAVGKLVALDLVRVALLWRIVLFMGFGAVLLGLSSMFRAAPPAVPEAERG